MSFYRVNRSQMLLKVFRFPKCLKVNDDRKTIKTLISLYFKRTLFAHLRTSVNQASLYLQTN